MDDPRRRGTWSEHSHCPNLLDNPRLFGECHLKYSAINGSRIDGARQTHLERILMGTGLDHSAKVSVPDSSRSEMITDEVIAGMGVRFVVSPNSAAQITKRSQAAFGTHDYVRIVNWQACIARVGHHRSG